MHESTTYEDLAKAIAVKAHEGQVRKLGEDKGKPYIIHPERIAEAVGNDRLEISDIDRDLDREEILLKVLAGEVADELKAIAWLHDVLEDTDTTEEDLLEKGIPLIIVEAVVSVTRFKGEEYLDYVLKAKANVLGRIVKIHDIQDNLVTLHNGSLRDKYLMALHILR